ncbi:fungal specific transcription factor domain-containing protein [Aspergillus vadensis CBS 113365]|uniref:Xylanolytic transcriptional activator regulatory domain-containing protein n=1 Tax=Aspergillus vadensis (strain CBS 113365 / IMI 142717 / IBT 24658) TaxID=1448311 RepID=A0A319AXF2_ASPVC|nr:hypothetical protein BO88DRAFT_471813 [Aspergillus vadensis CBS 113365]PYH64929.1 hypothetical protein BO88DRAFT_471813 [Aspergillus vadensis CBS 113365]
MANGPMPKLTTSYGAYYRIQPQRSARLQIDPLTRGPPRLRLGINGVLRPVSAVDSERSAVMAPYPHARIVRRPVWTVWKGELRLLQLYYLERRVRELERLEASPLRDSADNAESTDNSRSAYNQNALFDGNNASPTQAPVVAEHHGIDLGQEHHSPPVQSPAVSGSTQITRNQPLAHEVGLLSLANNTEPKYLGPSSGISFARLIYESAPQSQGLPLSLLQGQGTHQEPRVRLPTATGRALSSDASSIPPIPLPSPAESQQYAEAYFEGTCLYPFISQQGFYQLLSQIQKYNESSTWSHPLPIRLAAAQVGLVLSLGARFLEVRLGSDYDTNDLFVSAMTHSSQICLQDSVEGVQVLLLMVLHSFYSPDGLNAWYLLHTIIASCLDLGLQRRNGYAAELNSATYCVAAQRRSAIFWSAYSMDRTLTTILGRPLTLRDEAIDQPFPGLDASDEVEEAATRWYSARIAPEMNRHLYEQTPSTYLAFIYSLRFDRITAEIKLMIYRVSRSPRRFPWPSNISAWQRDTDQACKDLLTEVHNQQRGRSVCGPSSLSGTTVQRLEIKFHQCIMLLYRPSPQLPYPTFAAIEACFGSAMKIIQINTELHRFMNMEWSWLSAHTIFVAAITVLYCLWAYPSVRDLTPVTVPLSRVDSALELLTFLRRRWSVAEQPCEKLSRLITLTHETMRETAENQRQSATADDVTTHPTAETQLRNGVSVVPQEDGKSLLIDELGILRDLFDLGWLNDWGSDPCQPQVWDTSELMPGFDG